MAEASKIRLVRCPKCGNLQPEHSDYSVYQCVGCGAFLRAKRSINDGFLENSIKEKNVEGSLCSLSETSRENEKDRDFVRGNVDLVGVSSSRTEKEDFLVGNDHRNVGKKSKGFRIGPNNFERKIRYVDNCRQSSKHPIDDQVGGDDHDLNLNGSKSVNSSVVEGIGEVPAQLRSSSKVMRSRVVFDNQGAEREEFSGFDEDLGSDTEHSRFSPFAHCDGSSNYKSNSFYDQGKSVKKFDFRDERNGAEGLELNRSKFNRNLRDLKEQNSKLEGKPWENTLDDRNMGPLESYRDPVAYNVSMQPFFRDNHVVRPPNFNHSLGPSPFMNDHNLDNRNIYPPPRHVPHMMPRSNYEDPLQSHKVREPNNQPPPQYPPPPPLDCYLGQHMDFNQGVLASYPQEPFLHQPACICLHCGNRNWHIPPVVPQTGSSSGRPAQSNFNHRTNPVKFGPRNHIPIGAVPPPFHSRDSLRPMRWPIDIDLDVDAFYQSHPRRVVGAHGNRRLCHPIAGGAPFMLCHNCLELLKLPRKVMVVANNPQKLQCGTCSTSYSLEIRNKRLIISIPVETEKISGQADDVSYDPLKGGILRTRVCSTAGDTYSCSIEFDSGYDLQSADTKQNLLMDQISYLSEPENRQGQTSSSSISKEEEKSLNNVIVQKVVSDSADLPSKYDMQPTVSGSPFRNHFNDSASTHGVTGSGFGSRSKWTDQEKVVLNKIASHQNVEVNKVDQLRINRGHKTFLVGLIKESFRDFPRSTQRRENGRPNVSVNGQLIPNRLIKKAEKHAGPIEPGEYWYDSRAGFWGVMGQPCHGIITPYIEEFNYPMPENCAAGNTGVFVNGRELHQIDLDLLTSRGLPAIRNKKYIIETSGRVLDGDSLEELVCLGKLAPTVEKIKRGFGMRVPKVAF